MKARNKALMLVVMSFGLFSLSYAQRGEVIEAQNLCSEAVELEKKREQSGQDPATDLTTYCFDIPDSDIQDIDWQCILDTMKEGNSLTAARQSCNS